MPIAKIEKGLLDQEIGGEFPPRRAEHSAITNSRMGGNGDMGMSVEQCMPRKRKNSSVPGFKAVELFAGAGGLALGTAAAGFHHDAVIELNPHACETILANKLRGVEPAKNWHLRQSDIRGIDFKRYRGIDLMAGGPPCQPFSIGGKHKGPKDNRNLFPEVVRAVRESLPRAILIENVRGLLRPAFAKFFEYVLLQLSFPEVVKKSDENWVSHLDRLERHRTRGTQKGLRYNIVFRGVNAADFGAPQKRFRVFIVGFRSDLQVSWSFPAPTHSHEALLYDQYVNGDYWERHEVPNRQRPKLPDAVRRKVAELRSSLLPPPETPWQTVRDALTGLPDPTEAPSKDYFNHVLNPGAKVYAGHTGSPLDQPAKALKAGDHGVPGGENMLAYPDGTVRYFTVRESARLQTFPDNYSFSGSWTESMRQLGNAVPVRLAQVVATSIHERLK